MSDLLFIELGAVVKEVLGPQQCLWQPFCSELTPPTYNAADCFKVDFASSLLDDEAPTADAMYDKSDDASSNLPIGTGWPGGAYEGIIRIREDLLSDPKMPTIFDEAMASRIVEAAAQQTGYIYEHQVVAVIDELGKTVRRYRGFHAKVISQQAGGALVLNVAHGGKSGKGTDAELSWAMDPKSPEQVLAVIYNPADHTQFYSGPRVTEWAIKGGALPGSTGAVYILLHTATTKYGLSIPKKPPGGGL